MRIATTAVVITALVPFISASGCTLPPCGSFVNKNNFPALWGDLGQSHPDYQCQVWNSGGGPVKSNALMPCVVDKVYIGGRVGGWDYDKIDVDIFRTESGWPYYKSTYCAWGDDTELHHTSGYYVKIHSYEQAYFDGSREYILCNITTVLT
ncbi:hypothetical protein M011DRAFT_481300 [Sporormia fimetaria CBS 119925]|uniref:Lytic polysaccharide monooxygenase n=1 Tax=Sporormia fimetaria CBS 119925 TaxID=1340428 RepID=A0A6A6UZJ0_9PLEO|nr:hypothetical protein M011DRAFT_481300 [Sporormia fimetaria CBS 119925]